MAKADFKTVDEYIAAQPEDAQRILKRVRSIIRKAVPKAGEGISYKIPTYKLHGGPVLYFAGWKKHYSLYPASDKLVAAFKKDLAAYEVNKGTIRFPLSEPVPAILIESIAKFRADEVIGAQAARPRSKPRSKPRARQAAKKHARPVAKKPVVKKRAKPMAKKLVTTKRGKPAAKKSAKPAAKKG
jgi:uncharacterized protein YdhG (YjbR/CyaY superfamily)